MDGWIGILLSYWDGLFSGAMLVYWRVIPCYDRKAINPELDRLTSLPPRCCAGRNAPTQIQRRSGSHGKMFFVQCQLKVKRITVNMREGNLSIWETSI